MRTTLDIDPRVLAIARSQVRAGQSKSIGEAISRLALAGLDKEGSTVSPTATGLVLLPSSADRVITDEMVAEALLDE